MSKVHEFLSHRPLDFYQLHLFRLVTETGNLTRAGQLAGLTQSAITRQIQNMESQLGISLLNRTTRSVAPTQAGVFLLQESAPVLGDMDSLLRRLREEYANAPREVRVGVSKSVGLAYLPGFFSANVRHRSSIVSRVTHESSQTILASLESDALDIGVLLPPPRLSSRLRVTHRFRDAFTLIAHSDHVPAGKFPTRKSAELGRWLEAQPWLGLQDTSQTGRRLASWLKQQKLHIHPAMQLDNFDLIINLVALGVGVSAVPQRALALYGRRRTLVRIPWPKRFERELVIVIRRQRQTPAHIQSFVDHILF